jgi:hypothetical protein
MDDYYTELWRKNELSNKNILLQNYLKKQAFVWIGNIEKNKIWKKPKNGSILQDFLLKNNKLPLNLFFDKTKVNTFNSINKKIFLNDVNHEFLKTNDEKRVEICYECLNKMYKKKIKNDFCFKYQLNNQFNNITNKKNSLSSSSINSNNNNNNNNNKQIQQIKNAVDQSKSSCSLHFVVPGFMKAGTSYVFETLTKHPQVLKTLRGTLFKETGFFLFFFFFFFF